MLFNDKTEQFITDATQRVKDLADADYDSYIEKIVDYYHADFNSYFESDGGQSNTGEDRNDIPTSSALLQRYFPNAYDSGNGSLYPVYQKFTRRLINLKATLFHRRPRIVLQRKGKDVEKDSADQLLWDEIDKGCRLMSRLKELQRTTALCKTAFAFVGWRNGKLCIDPLTPNLVDVYQDKDDPGNLDACWMIEHELAQSVDSQRAETERRFTVWERPSNNMPEGDGPKLGEPVDYWSNRILDVHGNDLPNPTFEMEETKTNHNPYGMYPYVVFHEADPITTIFAAPDQSIRSAQEIVNLLWCKAHLAAMMATGVAVMKSQDVEDSERPWGSDVLVHMGPQDDFKFESTNFQYKDMVDFIQGVMQAYASMDGIHPDAFTINGESFSQAITAVAKQMDRMDLQEEREDSEVYWGEYQLPALADNKRFDKPEELTVRVEWAPSDAPMSPQEEAQAQQARFNAGMDDIIKWRQDEYGESEDEAWHALRRQAKARRIADGTDISIPGNEDKPPAAAVTGENQTPTVKQEGPSEG